MTVADLRVAPARNVGTSVLRVEDRRLLTGGATFVDDLEVPGMLYAAFFRSLSAHGTIRSLDVSRALQMPGVVAVLTGNDIAELTEPIKSQHPDVNAEMPPFYSLATGRVRYVGDPVAIVIAKSRASAEDAADRIELDIEELSPIMSVSDAERSDLSPLWPELGSNVVSGADFDYGMSDEAFRVSENVLTYHLSTSRVANCPMETRGLVVVPDPVAGSIRLHAAVQGPHMLRGMIAEYLRYPLECVEVVVKDVGGSFGQKSAISREEIAVAAAAKSLGRPVKWIEDRRENLMSSGHARGEQVDVEVAFTDEGVVTALRVDVVIDQGAYPAVPLAAAYFGVTMRTVLPGAYRIGGFRFRQRVISTNKAQYVTYRGPWTTETIVRETMIERVSRHLGLDPVVVRGRNIVQLSEQPRRMVTGPSHVAMNAQAVLDVVVERLGYQELREIQREQRTRGRLIGIGFSNLIEPAPGPPDLRVATGRPPALEPARAELDANGRLTVFTAQLPHGQSHQTTLSQVAADALGVSLEDVEVVYGDTRRTPSNFFGTGASMSATMASGAVRGACHEVRELVLQSAGRYLGVDAATLAVVDGQVVEGDSRVGLLSLADAVRTQKVGQSPPTIAAEFRFSPKEGGWTASAHGCVVEVDPGTGKVTILRYVVAEDCGNPINPAVVDGQIRGGTAQGIGQAMYETFDYAEDGAPLSLSLLDYRIPGIVDLPRIEVVHVHGPTFGESDHRGVGEGGAIGAPAAVANAVVDALSSYGAELQALPITPAWVCSWLD